MSPSKKIQTVANPLDFRAAGSESWSVWWRLSLLWTLQNPLLFSPSSWKAGTWLLTTCATSANYVLPL